MSNTTKISIAIWSCIPILLAAGFKMHYDRKQRQYLVTVNGVTHTVNNVSSSSRRSSITCKDVNTGKVMILIGPLTLTERSNHDN